MGNIVVVMMSTFNGMNYIQEQVDSIMDQEYLGEIILYIRDDGSTDGTVSFLSSYKEKAHRKILIEEGENIGPQRSFLYLIKNAPCADYYFFADQDDIWNESKIRIAVDALKGEKYPAVFCSNYRLIDKNRNILKEKAIDKSPQFRPLSVLFYNKIPGCTMSFNSLLMSYLQKLNLDNVIMHDSMTLSLCSLIGEIIYSDTPLIDHRIHGENVIGATPKKINFRTWIPEKLNLIKNGDSYDMIDLATQFLGIVNAEHNEKNIEDIHVKRNEENIRDMQLLKDYKNNYFKTIQLLLHKDCQGKFFDRNTLSVRCRIIFHIY